MEQLSFREKIDRLEQVGIERAQFSPSERRWAEREHRALGEFALSPDPAVLDDAELARQVVRGNVERCLSREGRSVAQAMKKPTETGEHA